jgi:hypothetical protein
MFQWRWLNGDMEQVQTVRSRSLLSIQIFIFPYTERNYLVGHILIQTMKDSNDDSK